MARQSLPRSSVWVRLLRIVAIAAIVGYVIYANRAEQQRNAPQPKANEGAAEVKVEESPDEPPAATRELKRPAAPDEDDATVLDESPRSGSIQTVVRSQTIRNQDDEVIYRGDVDLAATIARIERGAKLNQFEHDGITFENRERRLPREPRGYYREWVHPTPRQRGPGPQRVISGQEGEFWYTPDHYRSFVKLHP